MTKQKPHSHINAENDNIAEIDQSFRSRSISNVSVSSCYIQLKSLFRVYFFGLPLSLILFNSLRSSRMAIVKEKPIENHSFGWIPYAMNLADDTTHILEERDFTDNTIRVVGKAFNESNKQLSTLSTEIQILMSEEEISWMKNRSNHFKEWHQSPGKLIESADMKGPILDFLLIGFPKCGTTTLMANLAKIAPMPPAADVCTPPAQTTYYAYKSWPEDHGVLSIFPQLGNTSNNVTFQKIFRASKCPQFVGSAKWMSQYSTHFKRTKYIIGIRHPIKWFESFWRMQDTMSPYLKTDVCPCYRDQFGNRKGGRCGGCREECPRGQLFCLARARFHLPLARFGKTALSTEERRLLAPNDIDGGENIISSNITNPIFLYDQNELRDTYFWEELADFIGVSKIPNGEYRGSKGRGANHTLCDPFYDAFRAMMMPYSFELSMWLQQYFLPVAEDPSRPDVRVANPKRLSEIAKSYVEDPCRRLIRLQNGTYVLHPSLGEMIPPPKTELP